MKIVSQDELIKDSFFSVYSTGYILFKKAFQVFDKYSNNDSFTLSCIWNTTVSGNWDVFISFLELPYFDIAIYSQGYHIIIVYSDV